MDGPNNAGVSHVICARRRGRHERRPSAGRCVTDGRTRYRRIAGQSMHARTDGGRIKATLLRLTVPVAAAAPSVRPSAFSIRDRMTRFVGSMTMYGFCAVAGHIGCSAVSGRR